MSWGQIDCLETGLAELGSLDDKAQPKEQQNAEELATNVAYQNSMAEALLRCAGPDGKLDMSKLMRTLGTEKR